MMKVGILALQGDFREHEEILQRMGAATQQVRLPTHLASVDRLIIPGGESTTIGKLLVKYDLLEPIRERVGRDLALWGTCAGAILMARRILDGRSEQPQIGVMDIVVRRNGFGRQLDSFEAALPIPALGEPPVPGVFIRAPMIEDVGGEVEVMSRLPATSDPSNASIVAARQGRLFVTTFHPELTGDDRVHRYFLNL